MITTPAVPTTISVDGESRNDWGMRTDLPIGDHELCVQETTEDGDLAARPSAIATPGRNLLDGKGERRRGCAGIDEAVPLYRAGAALHPQGVAPESSPTPTGGKFHETSPQCVGNPQR